MTPSGTGGWFQARPRRHVEGGVAVPKPGTVSEPEALDIIAAAEMEGRPAILSRGRTYARAGQVIGVEVEPEQFRASIQGSDPEPYHVELTRIMISGSERIHASCTCPYTCDYDWCKHAAALAYVAAFLVDTQPATRAIWGGESPPEVVAPLTEIERQALLAAGLTLTFAQRLAAAEQIVPLPAGIWDRP